MIRLLLAFLATTLLLGQTPWDPRSQKYRPTTGGPTTTVQAALDAGQGLLAANVQPLLAKLNRNQEDASILVLGDSTGDEQTEWPYLLCAKLAARYPAYTVKYSLWNGTAWPAATTIATGTGAKILTLYNGSVAGSRFAYALGGRWAVMVQALTPDLIFLNYGHNQSTLAYTWWQDCLSLTESLTEQLPGAGMVMMLQNPSKVDSNQQLRDTVYEQVARLRGFGLINIMQVYLDYGAAWGTNLMADNVHPNAAGQLLWVAEVDKIFNYSRIAPIRATQPSSFTLKGGQQLLKNNDFAAFSSALPDNWVALTGSPTTSKELTNYESPNGYAVKIQAAGGVACALGQTLPLNACKGRWLTALVRIRREAGAANSVGVVALYDSVNGLNQDSDSGRGGTFGAYQWVVVSRYIPTTATQVRLYIYPDSGTANSFCTVDYASVVVGNLPMR